MAIERQDGTVQFSTRISKALHYAVKRAAIEDDLTLAQWISAALEAHMARTKPRQGTDE